MRATGVQSEVPFPPDLARRKSLHGKTSPSRPHPRPPGARAAHGLNAVAGTDSVSAQSAFSEGVRYTSRFGYRYRLGVCSIEKRAGVYHFTVPIRFVGAMSFAGCSPEMVKRESGVDAPATYFKPGAASIKQIPALAKRVRDICTLIEATLRTDRMRLHIEPIFPDERPIIMPQAMPESEIRAGAVCMPEKTQREREAHYRWRDLHGNLLKGAEVHCRLDQPVIIFINPTPDPNTISPTLWDPYANPLLLAHEFAHCLGIDTEGFEHRDYPADGIMKDESYFNALAAHGLAPRLLPSDFNEIMSFHSDIVSPPVDVARASREFVETSSKKYQQSVPWFDMSWEQRHAMAAEDVAALASVQKRTGRVGARGKIARS